MIENFTITTTTILPLVIFFALLLVGRSIFIFLVERRQAELAAEDELLRRAARVNGNNVANAAAVIQMQREQQEAEEQALLQEFGGVARRHSRVIRIALLFVVAGYFALCKHLYDTEIGSFDGYEKFVIKPSEGKQITPPEQLKTHKKAYGFCYAVTAIPLLLTVCLMLLWRTTDAAARFLASAGQHSSKKMYLAFAGILLVSLAVCAVTCVVMLSRYSLYCNYKPDEFERLCDFAKDVRDDVERVTGPNTVWLHNGALLAAWRPFDRVKNGFISNDHDFDLCIERKHFAKMKEYLAKSNKYYFAYWNVGANMQHPQKIRIYPHWAKLYEGHSGVWCVDIDECHYRKDPLTMLDGCNGHFWSVTSKRDSIAYFETEYPQGPWNKSIPLNHWALCSLAPGF